MHQEKCPYCKKFVNVFLQNKQTIPGTKEGRNKTIIIIKNYVCEECGCFIASRQEKIQLKE